MTNTLFCLFLDEHRNNLLALRHELARRHVPVRLDPVVSSHDWAAVAGRREGTPPLAVILNWSLGFTDTTSLLVEVSRRWPDIPLAVVCQDPGHVPEVERLTSTEPACASRTILVSSLEALAAALAGLVLGASRERAIPESAGALDLDHVSIAAITVTRDGLRLVRHNAEFARIAGRPDTSFIGCTLADIHESPVVERIRAGILSPDGDTSCGPIAVLFRAGSQFTNADAWLARDSRCTATVHILYIDASRRRATDSKWRKIAEAVSHSAGGLDYFRSLVRALVVVLGADLGGVLRVDSEHATRAEVLAAATPDKDVIPCEIQLHGHPAGETLKHRFVCITHDLKRAFPEASHLHQCGYESYIGLPLSDRDGRAIGVIEIMFRSRIEHTQDLRAVMQICAMRASAELIALAARASRQAEHQRTALAVGGAGLGTWDWHIPSGMLRTNKRWLQVLGLAPSDVTPHIDFWRARIHPEDLDAAAFLFATGAQTMPEHAEGWMRMRAMDGRWIWTLARGAVTETGPRGEAVRMSGTLMEGTSLREAELALGRSHALLAHTERLVEIGSFSWDLSTDQAIISPGMARILGIDGDPVNVRGADLLQRIHPDDQKAVNDTITLIRTEGKAQSVGFRIRRPDGDDCDVVGSADVAAGPSGPKDLLRGVIWDVTHQVRVKRELLDQLKFARTVCESVPTMIAHIDAEERYRYVNRHYRNRFPDVTGPLEGRKICEVLAPEVYAQLQPIIRRGLTRGERIEFDYMDSTRGTGEQMLHATYVPDTTDDGTIRGGTAFVQDITNEREIRQRMQTLLELADVAFAVIAIKPERVVYASPAYERIWGRSIEELFEKHRAWLEGVAAEDRHRVVAEVDAYQPSTHKPFRSEFTVVRPDGERRLIGVIARPIFDMHGHPKEMCVVADDLTAWRARLLAPPPLPAT